MTTRRDFLRKTSLALAGGLIVGDAAIEAFARLTHVRKSFPSAGVPKRYRAVIRTELPAVKWRLMNEGITPNGILHELKWLES